MNIPNLNQQSLEQILPQVQKVYPGATIPKPYLLNPKILRIPYEDFHFTVIKRKTDLKLGFSPPTAWVIAGLVGGAMIVSVIVSVILGKIFISIGGIIPALIGVLIVKAIFKSKNKAKIEQFNNSFIDIVNEIGRE